MLAAIWSAIAVHIIEISTAATALFTGLMAWVAWRQSRARLIAEWEYGSIWERTFNVRVTIRNGFAYSIRPGVITARPIGFITNIQPSAKEAKHPSWKPNQCAVSGIREIGPGQSSSFSFNVTVNSEAMHRQQKKLPARFRRLLSMLAWKSLSARVHHGASVHFQITIDSNLATSSRKRVSAKMRIPLTAIEQHIATSTANQSQS